MSQKEIGADERRKKAPLAGTLEIPQELGLRVQRFHLKVTAGPDQGKTFTSSGERAVIGSDESADLILTDPTVSRFHCDVSVVAGRPQIHDLDSKNGTRVDGVAVVTAYLGKSALITIGKSQLRYELGSDEVDIPLSRSDRFGRMVGQAPAMRAAFALLERAATSEATVLLEGETGTGKEVTTESIHLESSRRDGPLIVVDCGAIPPDLLESELFGHEAGAFTGAVKAREGAFEAANGGTIFLDEIGELSAALQPKLLRVLERKEAKRVGSNKYNSVDVRVVAATNRNLKTEVNAKRFRSDLYYRLAVVTVRLPPLRERIDDLPLLVERILESLDAKDHPEAPQIRAPEFMQELARHAWPGNVRELRNYIERCLALRDTRQPLGTTAGEGAEPSAANAGRVEVDTSRSLKEGRDAAIQVFEHRYLEQVLREANGNVAQAARAASVDRIYMYRLLWRHGLR
jgi:transcriptional regulator with PAS, ATPase and Fis domain